MRGQKAELWLGMWKFSSGFLMGQNISSALSVEARLLGRKIKCFDYKKNFKFNTILYRAGSRYIL